MLACNAVWSKASSKSDLPGPVAPPCMDRAKAKISKPRGGSGGTGLCGTLEGVSLSGRECPFRAKSNAAQTFSAWSQNLYAKSKTASGMAPARDLPEPHTPTNHHDMLTCFSKVNVARLWAWVVLLRIPLPHNIQSSKAKMLDHWRGSHRCFAKKSAKLSLLCLCWTAFIFHYGCLGHLQPLVRLLDAISYVWEGVRSS